MIAGIVAIAIVLAVCFWMRRQLQQARREIQSGAEEIRAEFHRWKEEGMPSPPPNGFNLSRRPDAVRRLRSGQGMDSVALSTGWAVPDLVLLQKIERITN